jgi:hypothetical protein
MIKCRSWTTFLDILPRESSIIAHFPACPAYFAKSQLPSSVAVASRGLFMLSTPPPTAARSRRASCRQREHTKNSSIWIWKRILQSKRQRQRSRSAAPRAARAHEGARGQARRRLDRQGYLGRCSRYWRTLAHSSRSPRNASRSRLGVRLACQASCPRPCPTARISPARAA